MEQISSNSVIGKVRAHKVHAHGLSTAYTKQNVLQFADNELWTPSTNLKPNTVLYQWATVAAKLLTLGQANYRIAGMYLEFENVASPGDTVSVPTFDRTRTVEYYDDLAGSATRDYLRVPLTATQLLSSGTGLSQNQIVFFARSSGTLGVHGKSFSDANNSVIYGASLVAFVDNSDATQDLLFSSFYFDVADQQPKLATSQVGIEWELTLQ